MRNNALQNRHIFSEQVSKLKRDSSTHEKLLVQGSAPTTPVSHRAVRSFKLSVALVVCSVQIFCWFCPPYHCQIIVSMLTCTCWPAYCTRTCFAIVWYLPFIIPLHLSLSLSAVHIFSLHICMRTFVSACLCWPVHLSLHFISCCHITNGHYFAML